MIKSWGEYELKKLLKLIFPRYTFEEQFYIGESLTLDFLCKKLSLAFEFQGPQHDEFNPHFQKDEKGLIKQQQRDRKKKRWCKLNEITLIEVRENELNNNNLRQKINRSLTNDR